MDRSLAREGAELRVPGRAELGDQRARTRLVGQQDAKQQELLGRLVVAAPLRVIGLLFRFTAGVARHFGVNRLAERSGERHLCRPEQRVRPRRAPREEQLRDQHALEQSAAPFGPPLPELLPLKRRDERGAAPEVFELDAFAPDAGQHG